MRGLPFSEGKGGGVVGDGERRGSGKGQHALTPGTSASFGPMSGFMALSQTKPGLTAQAPVTIIDGNADV